MATFLYSAWFLDAEAAEGDQDREWVACIGIDATGAEEAQKWGDALAMSRQARLPTDKFLHSSIEITENALKGEPSVPHIRVGESATDDEIGW